MYRARNFVLLSFLDKPVLLLFVTCNWEQAFVLPAATAAAATTTATTTVTAKLHSL
jgi:hypothetical protein